MHGVARVMVKDYASDRNRALRAKMPRPAEAEPGVERRLLHDLAQMGMGGVHRGSSPDGPLVN